jgi:hypothetical protein
VLSWSLINALACGATVLASDTAPVREVIEHGKNGLLADFFDVDGLASTANQVLERPKDFQHLGAAGVEQVQDRYSLDACLPQMLELYEEVRQSERPHSRLPSNGEGMRGLTSGRPQPSQRRAQTADCGRESAA